MDVRPASRIALAAGARLIHEVHDLWPLTPILLGGMPPHHPMIAWMQREENFACENADLVVSLLPGTETYLKEHGLPPGKWAYVPNGVSLPIERGKVPEDIDSQFQTFRRQWSRLIVFAGGHAEVANLDALLGHLPLLRANRVGVVLIGDGPAKGPLQEAFGQFENVLFLPLVQRAQAATLISQCDAGYAGALPLALYEYGFSFNKIFDYMAAGVPVIENVNTTTSLIGASKSGFISDPARKASLTNALQDFIDSSDVALESLGTAGQIYVNVHHSRQTLAKQFVEVITAENKAQQR